MVDKKQDIRKYSKAELTALLEGIGQPKYRANQIFKWLWQDGTTTFDEMTNLSKELRTHLDEQFTIQPIRINAVQKSEDGTVKTRFKLHDGFNIETVLIPVHIDGRYTVCVSCQVGCSLSCSFCATGRMKRERNLNAGEIVDQVRIANQQCLDLYGKRISNIVYMGMGEPLLAYKEVKRSIELITSADGLNISSRRITVSTAGIAKMIRKIADDGARYNLALSLHAADDEKRNEIMPINESNNLSTLMASLEYFYKITRNRISYEYIAFQDFNDSIEDAKNLARLCSRFPVRINIIEYNPVDGMPFRKSTQGRLDDFARYLRDKDIMVTVRRSRGRDIDAACGQLANKTGN
jgi:23S rRNA (adenine2503-C2)-methyltransferase